MEAVTRLLLKVIIPFHKSPMKEACAEFLGTFFLVVCGNGVMANIVLGRVGQSAAIISAFGWGLALMIGVAIAGGISGGHLNPAVSVAMATVKKCPWKHMIPYLAAQYLSSFIAAGVVYLIYADAIYSFDNGYRQLPSELNSTAQIFSTYPQDFASIGSCFIDQVLGSCLLLLVICAATDDRNLRLPPHVQASVIGLGLTAVCLAFGYNCGAPLNPARDFSPRLFTALAGWGWEVFSFRNYTWFWVPIVGPHVGAILGVWIYGFLIDVRFFIHLPFGAYGLHEDEIGILDRTKSLPSTPIPSTPDHEKSREELSPRKQASGFPSAV